MINRSCSSGLIVLFLLLSACGGGGGASTASTPQSSTSVGATTNNTSVGKATAGNGTISLKWAAPAARSNGGPLALSEISEYTIYFGTEAGNYPYAVSVRDPSKTKLEIPNLPIDTYYLVITATDSQGRESGFSNVAVKKAKAT